MATLRPWQAVAIGTSQAISLFPGFSRSGATMVGGLLVGLEHQSAARFSFLLATPIILAAAVLEVPKLLQPARDLRVAEVEKLDVTIESGKVTSYRARLSISFKYESGD